MVTPAGALAFRLAGHHLHERLPAGSLAVAASACAIQDTPAGNGLVSMHARVEGVTAQGFDGAVDAKELVRVWSLRGAPFFVPRDAFDVYTIGARPATEESMVSFLNAYGPALKKTGTATLEALETVTKQVLRIVRRAPASKASVSEALHGKLSKELEPWCRGCGVHHVNEQMIRGTGLTGRVCFVAPETTMLGATKSWLGEEPQAKGARQARLELARRYLRCYGPSTAGDFATWTGIGRADATATFDALFDELAEVKLDGKKAWILDADRELLDDPPPATGVRLVPSHDPILAMRPRSVLVEEPERQKETWRMLGHPGLLLVDGRAAGSWRARVKGKRLDVTVNPWRKQWKRKAVEGEADAIAALRGLESASVSG